MSGRAALHRAGAQDAATLLPLIAAFHAEEGIAGDDTHISNGIAPLLAGSPHGEIFLIGPRRAPAGYACVIYGWSIEFGGLDSYLDELYLRPAVRGRGMGTDVIHALADYLRERGARSLYLEVDHDSTAARKLYERAGFTSRESYALMVRTL